LRLIPSAGHLHRKGRDGEHRHRSPRHLDRTRPHSRIDRRHELQAARPGDAYIQIAAGLALESVNITVDDLRIANDKRAAEFSALARLLLERADSADAATASSFEFFDIVDTGGGHRPMPVVAPAPPTSPTTGLTESPLYPGLWS
jgi:hypothetical protein